MKRALLRTVKKQAGKFGAHFDQVEAPNEGGSSTKKRKKNKQQG
jgi:hypothetical protein